MERGSANRPQSRERNSWPRRGWEMHAKQFKAPGSSLQLLPFQACHCLIQWQGRGEGQGEVRQTHLPLGARASNAHAGAVYAPMVCCSRPLTNHRLGALGRRDPWCIKASSQLHNAQHWWLPTTPGQSRRCPVPRRQMLRCPLHVQLLTGSAALCFPQLYACIWKQLYQTVHVT